MQGRHARSAAFPNRQIWSDIFEIHLLVVYFFLFLTLFFSFLFFKSRSELHGGKKCNASSPVWTNKIGTGAAAHLSTLCAALIDGAAVIKSGSDELELTLILKSALYDDVRTQRPHEWKCDNIKRSLLIIAILPPALVPGDCDKNKYADCLCWNGHWI